MWAVHDELLSKPNLLYFFEVLKVVFLLSSRIDAFYGFI